MAKPEEKPPSKILILCDFDGTISTTDTVNRVLREHISSPEWRFPVKRYLRGEIGSREVYEALAPLMRVSRQQLEDFILGYASLDPHFPAFLHWAQQRGIDVKVVSDGFDVTIRTLFQHHGIEGVEIFANTLLTGEDRSVRIFWPYADPDCGRCGTCKRNIIRSFRSDYDKIILVGDGESDRHAAAEADLVLALADLFVYCAREGIPAVRVDGFHEVPQLLARRIEAVTFDMDGTLLDSIGAITDAFNHMFARLGYPTMTAEEVVRHTSISLVDFVNSFLKPEETEKAIKIFRDYYDTIYLRETKMMPGARETLDALDGSVITGVVTNKRGVYARNLAEYFGFAGKLTRIIGAQDGFKAKPNPDMFDEFVQSVGVEKSKTVYVGDTPLDIESARNAGIDALVVSSSMFPPEELALCGPRRVLSHITELPDAIKPLI
jgi:2,3-diketo-5-methylthio-1-phosphopentane phosphatase/HAD superfamily hydrolase (TIGR01509 family)